MATPPDFTAGSVLTAAQMNAVGLWRITGCTVTSVGGTAATASNGVITVGSGNTSITVSSAFSADFDNYRIIYTGGTGSAAGAGINLQLGASTTTYYNVLTYAPYASGAYSNLINNNTLGYWYFAGNSDSTYNAILDCELYEPQKARYTRFASNFIQYDAAGRSSGIHQTATAYTAFTLTLTAGSLTGGTIRVYGYRN